jgi:hypothetical protein
MTGRLIVLFAVAVGISVHAAPQSGSPVALYVDAPASARDYSVHVDGAVVSDVTITRGPQPLSVIVLYDLSDSVRPISVESGARLIAGAARPGDHIRLASFADRILIGSTPVADRASATKAAREVTQAGGASPLWDAICASVEVLGASRSLRAIVVFSDGQANANDRGADDALETATRAGVIVSVAGVADSALRVPSAMQVIGRNAALRRLAQDTGGEFTEQRSREGPGTALKDALNEFRTRVRLEFVPPVRDGAVHRVSVMSGGKVIHGPVTRQF